MQGLILHEYVASAYGVIIPEQRKSESHIRRVAQMLDCVLAGDPRPLTAARPPENRLVGVCHHFMLFLVAMLCAKGVPARARCGFASYFNPGYFEDHWICEYWNTGEERWVRLEVQSDEVWRRMLKIDFDPLDVPPDRFVTAGDAWVQCRAGQADASKFGIFKGNLRGHWFIAGNLVRISGRSTRWKCCRGTSGARAMPRLAEPLQDDQLTFFDQLAARTCAPDASFEQLRRLYQDDNRVLVPATVFNAVLNRAEAT